jgi:hypothetical protein
MNWYRALMAWFLIVIAESINGTLRRFFLAPALGDLLARQVGVLIGSTIIFAIAVTFIRWIGARSFGQQFRVGLLWVVLIVVFEFGLGAILGYSRERMLSDYNIVEGGFMLLGLLFMLFAPALAAKARGFGRHPVDSGVKGHLS